MKNATVNRRKGIFYISSSSLSTDGVWLATQPYFKIEGNFAINQLGESIVNALQGSKQNVPHPTDFRNFGKDFLLAMGLKSFSQIQDKHTFHCSVTEDNGIISITPSKNKGDNKGFSYLAKSEAILISKSESPESIGNALLQAFAKCLYEPTES